MGQKKYFSASGLAVAVHTNETEKIWDALPNNLSKSDHLREAVYRYAKDLGFDFKKYGEKYIQEKCKGEGGIDDLDPAHLAFEYLLDSLPDITGVKSYILRHALIHYC